MILGLKKDTLGGTAVPPPPHVHTKPSTSIRMSKRQQRAFGACVYCIRIMMIMNHYHYYYCSKVELFLLREIQLLGQSLALTLHPIATWDNKIVWVKRKLFQTISCHDGRKIGGKKKDVQEILNEHLNSTQCTSLSIHFKPLPHRVINDFFTKNNQNNKQSEQ